MEEKVLRHLEWSKLLEILASKAATDAGRQRCQYLRPIMTKEEIELVWAYVDPLRSLIRLGYRPPIGDLCVLDDVLKGASLGQIFDGEQLWKIHGLLDAARQVHLFCSDFSEKCLTLNKYKKLLYPIPNLTQAIEKAISPEGDILDDASDELLRIRRAKVSARRNIEKKIRQILVDSEVETYLQDKFFTQRSDRYVVPIRLDGRGRVKGSIYDTSDSGQTLFIEPEDIRSLNESLLDLELSEKLEIARIFRELSGAIADEVEQIKNNYELIIELDFYTAQADLAFYINATRVKINDEPCMVLLKARHPLLGAASDHQAVGNDIVLKADHRSLIVSGPNAGGKTVVLKTVGMLHLMLRAGLMLPCDSESQVFLFSNIFMEMGDAQSLSSSLSTFSGHLLGLKPIMEMSTPDDLVLLDELAVGTEPETGGAIAQSVLEFLVKTGVTTLVTTHYDNLKALPMQDSHFRNGSMQFSQKNLKPTYNLVMDLPGQSFGLEVAQEIGLPVTVVERAKEIRGSSETTLDKLIDSLQRAREQAISDQGTTSRLRIEAQTQKAHWEAERQALREEKANVQRKVSERYQRQIDQLKQEFHQSVDEMQRLLKEAKKHSRDVEAPWEEGFKQGKRLGKQKIETIEQTLDDLGVDQQLQEVGHPCRIEDLQAGQQVFVKSLGVQGAVAKVIAGPPDVIEVQAGLMKFKADIADLRSLVEPDRKDSQQPQTLKKSDVVKSGNPEVAGLVLPTPSNSVDVRGMDVEKALEVTWGFIDKAVLRGETHLIIIHGHGTDRLKKALRSALAKDSPYQLDFRPGEAAEGGDGATVVSLG